MAQPLAMPGTAGDVASGPDDAQGTAVQEWERVRVEQLNEHRKWLLDVDHQTSISFDKVLITLSAGALGIAVNLGRAGAAWAWALKLSWACFTASLLSILLSYLCSRNDLRREIGDVDWKLQHGPDEEPPPQRRAWHEVSTTHLNIAALVSLILGIYCLVAYAATNL
jgi:hypothetical protein